MEAFISMEKVEWDQRFENLVSVSISGSSYIKGFNQFC